MKTPPPVKEPADLGDRHRLSVIGGLAALSLDAMASVAYGPEAIVLVLALAGGAGLGSSGSGRSPAARRWPG
ncbi:hypothetical protein [Nonomuraea sp. NEAU-A123]|uniref:hypothetical protein n=1 Tax=Nonomuraea sp. NEAU-A123 TaxID=2839649 RepID=UPI001BE47FC1|nr:hypothetical protein [Nonomuraea sp. NEAU-A123]MBT2234839.1 hypothetical protein [Nonomuraea sp. NEAU-A123]